MRAFVDLNKWVRDFEKRARRELDADRVKLTQLDRQGWQLLQRSPEEALPLFEEGAALARQLKESHWELWYEYWILETYLYYLALIDLAERWAIRNFVKVHQAAYQDCPFIGRIYLAVIYILYFKDAEGNQAKIVQMLDYLEQHVPLEYETYTRIVRTRAGLFYVMEDWETAASHGKRHLELVQTIPFQKVNAYAFLASIAYHQQHAQELLEYGRELEHAARQAKLPFNEGIAALAEAHALMQLNDPETARQCYERGLHLSADLSSIHSQAWYNYACGYQEANGNLSAALELRDQQLAGLKIRDLPAHETYCRFARLRLLGKMEEETLFKAELEATRQVITRLKSPIVELNRLKRIEQGDYSL